METPPCHCLSDAEKDALLLEQAALIGRLAARIEPHSLLINMRA